jgi:hypothetical protein
MKRTAILVCHRHMLERVRRHWWELRGRRGLIWYQTARWWLEDLEEPEGRDVWESVMRRLAGSVLCERCGNPMELADVVDSGTRPALDP